MAMISLSQIVSPAQNVFPPPLSNRPRDSPQTPISGSDHSSGSSKISHSGSDNTHDPSKVSLSGSDHNEVTKRIAIIGAGPSGISALQAFITNLPDETRRMWQIVLFEKRNDVGGIWYEKSALADSLHPDNGTWGKQVSG
jgi:FAD-NAD(P)-binding